MQSMPARRIDVDLPREGRRLVREGALALAEGRRTDAQAAWRKALSPLVEGFFEDRRENADLFALAHSVGEDLARLFGCPLTIAEDGSVSNPCPVPMLHSRIGTSPALVVDVECSICGSPPLLCLHENGHEYDGVVCQHRITHMEADHLAFTADPDFAWGFMIQVPISAAQVEGALGRPGQPGEPVWCAHCQDCYGKNGPSAEDLSPPRELPEVH